MDLSRKLHQERETDELHRLAAHRKDEPDRGIDWMYHGGRPGGAFAEEQRRKEELEAEEYLLGKEYNAAKVKRGDLAAAEGGATPTGLEQVMQSVQHKSKSLRVVDESVTGHSEAPTGNADWNETFRLRYEDPMYMVEKKKAEQQAEAHKRRLLLQRVATSYESGAKRHEREEDTARSSSSSFSSSSSSSSRRKRKSHTKKSSKKQKREKERHKDDRRHRHRDEMKDKKTHKEKSEHDKNEKSCPSSSSTHFYHPSSIDHYDHGEKSLNAFQGIQGDSSTQQESGINRQQGFGLQHKNGHIQKHETETNKKTHLGPDQALLHKKRWEDQQKRKHVELARSRNYTNREEALQQMQMDAQCRKDTLTHMADTSESMVHQRHKEYDQDLRQRSYHGHNKANFIQDITTQVSISKSQKSWTDS